MQKWLVLLVAGGLLASTGCKDQAKPTEGTKPPETTGSATPAKPTTGGPTETIKVGILHSLSGTMAISETSLKDVALMTIDEINSKGGILGKQVEAVVVDPASNWPLFAEK